MNPKISVLITVYNREKYLAEAIKSVLSSSMQDYEIILVDDCSTDNSLRIAESFANKDDRIKIFKNDKNLGDYPNRNKAASLAKGKYIKFLDSDDLIYPHGLEIMLNTMEQFPKAGLGISQEVFEDYNPYPFILSPQEVYYRQFLKRGILDTGPTGTIINRKIFNELGGFSGTRYIGDTELWLKISALYPVVKIQSGLVFWRRHEGQEFQLGNQNSEYAILTYQVKSNALNNGNCPLKISEKNEALAWVEYRFLRAVLHVLFKRQKVKRAFQFWSKSNLTFVKLLLAVLPWNWFKQIRLQPSK